MLKERKNWNTIVKNINLQSSWIKVSSCGLKNNIFLIIANQYFFSKPRPRPTLTLILPFFCFMSLFPSDVLNLTMRLFFTNHWTVYYKFIMDWRKYFLLQYSLSLSFYRLSLIGGRIFDPSWSELTYRHDRIWLIS